MTSDSCQTADARAACRRCWLAAGAVTAIFLAFAVPLILIDHQLGRGYVDQRDHHHVVIQRFAREWPAFHFSDYESMTTPGYHVLLAGALRAVSDDIRFLRLMGSLFTVGLLATLACALARRMPAANAVALCLPVVCSVYVFSSGIWLLPDNAAWWCVLGVILVALRNEIDARTYLLGGIALLALVWMRQIHIWSAAVLWMAAWIGAASNQQADPILPALLGADRRAAFQRSAWMFIATLPALITVWAFHHLWGGFTVPMYQHFVAQPSGSAPAVIFALFACFGLFYMPYVLPRWRGLDRTAAWRMILIGAGFGMLIGALPATSADRAAGRHSGIWYLVNYAPVLADRSLLMIALSTAGGGLIGLWFAALGGRDRWIFLVALGAFIAAQVPGARAWQRYYEPFLLILLAVFASRMIRPTDRDERSRGKIAGPLMLAALLACVTVAGLTLFQE